MIDELAKAIAAALDARDGGKRPVEAYEAGKRLLPPMPANQFELAIQALAEAAGL